MLKTEILIYVLSAINTIGTTANLLGDMRVEHYQRFSSKCDLNDVNVVRGSTSIGTCARICTETPTCKGFVMKQGDCGLLEACPTCCRQLTEAVDGWSVFCPGGNVYTLKLFYANWTKKLWDFNIAADLQ